MQDTVRTPPAGPIAYSTHAAAQGTIGHAGGVRTVAAGEASISITFEAKPTDE